MYEQEGESENVVVRLFVCLPVVYIQFPQDCVFFPPSFQQTSLFLSSPVRFRDCGRAGPVRLESNNPSDFRIEADGVVYAARGIQRSPQHPLALLIKAIDSTTQQQWITQVWMVPPALSSQQVNTHPSLHT